MIEWPKPGKVLSVGPAGAEEGHCIAASQDGYVATFTSPRARTRAIEFSDSTVMLGRLSGISEAADALDAQRAKIHQLEQEVKNQAEHVEYLRDLIRLRGFDPVTGEKINFEPQPSEKGNTND